MSKEELTKWANKLKLWKVMHPEMIQKDGEQMIYSYSICKKMACPYYRENDNRVCTEDKKVEFLGVSYDCSTLKSLPFSKLKKDADIAGCVEWIKYV